MMIMKRVSKGVRWASLVLGMSVTLLMGLPAQAFHFPWDQGHDTTDWSDPNNPGPCEGPNCDPCNSTGSPIYIPTGHFIWPETDIVLLGHPGLSLARTYNSNDPRDGIFGNGWTMEGETGLFVSTAGENIEFNLRLSNGKHYVYQQQNDGTIAAPRSRFDTIETQTSGELHLVDLDNSRQIFNAKGQLSKRVASNGASLQYSYDNASGLLTRIADQNGRFIDLKYNSAGRVAEALDHTGRLWAYSYDTNGNLSTVTDPLGGAVRYEYTAYQPLGDGHTYWQLTKITDAAGVIVSNVMYANDKVSSYTVGQNKFSYSYDLSNQKVTKTDLTGSRWIYTYNEDQLITRITDPLNKSKSFSYDDNGRMVSITDESGEIWQVGYDEKGRKVSETDPLDNVKRWEYSGSLPQPVRAISFSGRITTLAYDSNGNLVTITDPSGAATRLTWDGNRSVTSIEDPLSNKTSITNDVLGRPLVVTDALGRETRFTYDTVGNVTRIENALGQAFAFEYDLLDRLVKTTQPSGNQTQVSYDAAGRVLARTDADGSMVQYSYDSYGRLIRREDGDGRAELREYRSDNLRSRMILPDGTAVTYDYDAAKHLTSRTVGTLNTTYEYSDRGQLIRATNTTGSIILEYDKAGRLVEETNNGQTVQLDINSEGEVIGLTSGDYQVAYSRDERGFITQIAATTGDYQFDYDAIGRRTKLTLPNGSQAEYFYNLSNQLVRIVHSGGFNADYNYEYDNRGFIERWQGDSFDWNYQYTQDNALSQATNGIQQINYNYDSLGNRVDEGRQYDSGNRLVEDDQFNYTYDLRGNLTLKQDKLTGARTAYSWNSLNQLDSIARYPDAVVSTPNEQITFSYGPLGRRWSKVSQSATEQYVYNGTYRIATLSDSGTPESYYTHGPFTDELLGAETPSGMRYYHVNHQNSVMALTDDTGSILTEYSYTPFGLTTASNNTENDFRYVGREFEADDLYFYRARYYDPSLGRYLNEDPLGFAGGSGNLYNYAFNNPSNLTDPSGKILPALAVIWAGVEIGLAIYDAYDTASTILDPCTSGWEKALAGGLFVAGALLPGGGYSAADDIAESAVRACCCFQEGTLVSTAQGLKPIERISKGELLASQNEHTGELGWQPVTELFVTDEKTIYALTLVDNEGVYETVYVTDDHPYRVHGLGWVESGALEPGMAIESLNGWLEVVELKKTSKKRTTFNLEVADTNTYFVGQQQALVHNCSCNVLADRAREIHELAPQATQNRTTIAVTEAVDQNGNVVNVVSSSEQRLRRTQREALQPGEVEAIGPGHAEVTGVNYAQQNGMTPTATAASRPICDNCAQFLSDQGVQPASPLKNP